MKKSFFNKSRLHLFWQEMKENFAPIFVRPFNKVKNRANKNPKRTVFIMLGLVAINFAVLVYFSEQYKKKEFSYSNINTKTLSLAGSDSLDLTFADIPFTWNNYRKLSLIKDSLEYLIKKQDKTSEDTLLFIRIFEQYNHIDPHFYNNLKKIEDEKRTKLSSETDSSFYGRHEK